MDYTRRSRDKWRQATGSTPFLIANSNHRLPPSSPEHRRCSIHYTRTDSTISLSLRRSEVKTAHNNQETLVSVQVLLGIKGNRVVSRRIQRIDSTRPGRSNPVDIHIAIIVDVNALIHSEIFQVDIGNTTITTAENGAVDYAIRNN